MKLALVLAGIAFIALAGPATAAEPLPLTALAPEDGVTVARVSDVLFEATLGGLAPLNPSAVVVDVARAPDLDPNGTLADANVVDSLVLDPSGTGSTFADISPSYVRWHAAEGTYYWQVRAERRRGPLVGPVRTIQVRSPFGSPPQGEPAPGQPIPEKPEPARPTPTNQANQLRPKLDVFDVGDSISRRGVALWLWCDGCRVDIRPRLLLDGRVHRLPRRALETGGEVRTRLRLRARDRRLAARALARHRRVALQLSFVGRNTMSDQRDSERVTRRIWRASR